MGLPSTQLDTESQLAFLNGLHAVANKIHSAVNVDEIMLDVSRDIRELFNCDRLTIYTVRADRTRIESKIKTDMNKFKDFSLPITSGSVAGYCALSKKLVNLRDVYDEAELKSHSADLSFLDKVDQRTQYVTKEMLAAPILGAGNGELLGVVQLINNRAGGPFPVSLEDGVRELCKTLSIAFAQRLKNASAAASKYSTLVTDGVISQAELALATRAARRKGMKLEDVLVDEFQIRLADVGNAFASFFDVPYEPFRENCERPAVLGNLKREYIETQYWLPLGEMGGAVVIVTTDPERVMASGVAKDVFPGREFSYRVTTRREFVWLTDRFFGPSGDATHTGARQASRTAETQQDLADQAHALVARALRTLDGAVIDVMPRPAENVVASEGANGTLASVRGQIVIDFRIVPGGS